MEEVLFSIIATATGGSALGVVLSKSMVRAALWLLFTLIGVSLTFFLLGAEFLGAAQLIVYVGGTLVLVAFGVMLTSGGPNQGFRPKKLEWIVGVVLAGGLFLLLARSWFDLPARATTGQDLPGAGPLGLGFLGVTESGQRSGTSYLLPFEILSVHMLVVLVAAAYMARAKRRGTEPTGEST